jgi:hypothetical protein
VNNFELMQIISRFNQLQEVALRLQLSQAFPSSDQLIQTLIMADI